eukprot:690720-Prymnesium_polylepis.1
MEPALSPVDFTGQENRRDIGTPARRYYGCTRYANVPTLWARYALAVTRYALRKRAHSVWRVIGASSSQRN